jgi:AmmeMemoRadiSam system protein A
MRHFLHNWSEKRKKKLAEARSREDLYVRLARAGVESAVRSKRKLPDRDIADLIRTEAADMDLDPAQIMAAQRDLLYRRAGVFVSIHKNGSLRGCIGTIAPTCSSIAQEIAQNAVSASTKDPRFPAIRPSELDELEITVDVLGETEKISSPDQLDVKRYGVIVSKGRRRGLLLPNLDGVDTVEEQIGIALQKAGLDTDEENYELERFEVVRHY